MEPKLPTPNIGPERLPASYGQNLEQTSPGSSPEATIERRAEQLEQRSEGVSATSTVVPVLPPPVVLPLPSPTTDTTTMSAGVSNIPLVANDDDLIEKEWVDQAKKIIVQTKDDPYKREQEVSKLQADYLRKRYGRELGAS
jgi:hypothetical protein